MVLKGHYLKSLLLFNQYTLDLDHTNQGNTISSISQYVVL